MYSSHKAFSVTFDWESKLGALFHIRKWDVISSLFLPILSTQMWWEAISPHVQVLNLRKRVCSINWRFKLKKTKTNNYNHQETTFKNKDSCYTITFFHWALLMTTVCFVTKCLRRNHFHKIAQFLNWNGNSEPLHCKLISME